MYKGENLALLVFRNTVLVAIILASALSAVSVAFAADDVAEESYVRNAEEFRAAMRRANAGDVIILANGEWRDFDMVVTGEGQDGEPITVRSEEAGKVILTGQSSLRIAGTHLLVSGLVFRDGYSPRGEVISFRRTRGDLASHSRVTQMVIDGYSKPDRYESDYWVGVYGKSNRFDHNHLAGKTNKGVTLAVRLDSEESRDNGHLIDHNYFGPRPVLGSNGGETLRIGTSRYSMYDSGTIVENNIFDRTDGEVEIISSKSGRNVFRGNVFLNSRGTLTLRHGDNNVVERNVFIGGGKDYTGGIRVINRGQIVRDNYIEGMRGVGFASALTVMNGVPNSPVNRYVQVEDAIIERNSVIDSSRITLGAGADEERSAPPISTQFTHNLLSGAPCCGNFVEVDADISGLTFSNNHLIDGEVHSAFEGRAMRRDHELVRASNGLLYPADDALAGVGAPRDLEPVSLDAVGVEWYQKPSDETVFGSSGRIVHVGAGEGDLVSSVIAADDGDELVLTAGEYFVDRTILLSKAITIRGASSDGGAKPVVFFARPSLFELRDGGNIKLENLIIDGARAPDSVGNSMIRTSASPIQRNFRIEMDAVTVRNLVVNKSFNVLTLGKSAFADRISIQNSFFKNITGAVVSASSETEDFGQYNVEYLHVTGNEFENIGDAVANVYRGGRDESTFGPYVLFVDNKIENTGGAATNVEGASLYLHGVQISDLERNVVKGSAPFRIVHTVGTPRTKILENWFFATPELVLEELNFDGAHRATVLENVYSTGAQK